MIFLKLKLKRLQKQSAPDANFKAALRARLVADQPEPAMLVRGSFLPPARYAFAMSAMVLVLVFGTGSFAYASTSVTSGDLLYPVKTGIEDIEEVLKVSPAAKAKYQARMLDRRAQEIAYRLRNDKPLRARDAAALAQAMNLTVEELKGLKADEAALELAKTELKLKVVNSLTTFRTQIELSDELTETQKDLYLNAIDERLEKIESIPTTAPLE